MLIPSPTDETSIAMYLNVTVVSCDLSHVTWAVVGLVEAAIRQQTIRTVGKYFQILQWELIHLREHSKMPRM